MVGMYSNGIKVVFFLLFGSYKNRNNIFRSSNYNVLFIGYLFSVTDSITVHIDPKRLVVDFF